MKSCAQWKENERKRRGDGVEDAQPDESRPKVLRVHAQHVSLDRALRSLEKCNVAKEAGLGRGGGILEGSPTYQGVTRDDKRYCVDESL